MVLRSQPSSPSWTEVIFVSRDEKWYGQGPFDSLPLRLPAGGTVSLTYCVKDGDIVSSFVELSREDGATLILPGAADESRSRIEVAVTCAFGTEGERIALLGGWRGYLVASGPDVVEEWPFFLRSPWRDRETALWRMSLREVEAGLLVDYEGGILLLGRALSCIWHMPKHFFDRCVEVDGDVARFVNDEDDEEERFAISLREGVYTGPARGRDPRLFLVFDGSRRMVERSTLGMLHRRSPPSR